MSNAKEACNSCEFRCQLEEGARRIVERARDGELNGTNVKQATSVLSQRAGKVLCCPTDEIIRIRRDVAEKIGDPKLVNLLKNYTILPSSTELRPDTTIRRETYLQYVYRRRHRSGR